MLDLNKYLARAEADPGFRQRLLQDANQAIRDEFGEDLPYNLKCKVKLVFEIEPMDGLSEGGLSGAAGGCPGPYGPYKKKIVKKNGSGSANLDPRANINNAIYTSMPITQSQPYLNEEIPGYGNNQPEVGYSDRGYIYGSLSDNALGGVAGGMWGCCCTKKDELDNESPIQPPQEPQMSVQSYGSGDDVIVEEVSLPPSKPKSSGFFGKWFQSEPKEPRGMVYGGRANDGCSIF